VTLERVIASLSIVKVTTPLAFGPGCAKPATALNVQLVTIPVVEGTLHKMTDERSYTLVE